MKVSEAIQALQVVLAEHGDLEMVTVDFVEGVGFVVEFDQAVEVLGLPETDGSETMVCAVGPGFELDDDPEPDPKGQKNSKLTFVK